MKIEIPFGHSASQAPVLVQLQILLHHEQLPFVVHVLCVPVRPEEVKQTVKLSLRGTTSRMHFTQEATQAPQPIQAAASKASSAFTLAIGRLFASGALPVFTEMYPPACMIFSNLNDPPRDHGSQESGCSPGFNRHRFAVMKMTHVKLTGSCTFQHPVRARWYTWNTFRKFLHGSHDQKQPAPCPHGPTGRSTHPAFREMTCVYSPPAYHIFQSVRFL